MATFFNGRIKTTKIEEGVYTVITGILDGQKTVVARALTENQAAVDRVEAGVVELLLDWVEDFGEGDLDVVRLDGRIAELDERLSNEIDNIGYNVIGVEANVTELQTEVEDAVRELDTQIQTNADNVALKVNTSDIVNDLTSTDTDKPLSANQGKVLNETTAKLTASNVFTQPQIVPNAENDDEAVNLGQLNTHIRSNYYDIEKVDIIMEDLDTHIRSNYYDKDYIDDLEENITQHVNSNYYDINEIDNKLESLVVDGGNV